MHTKETKDEENTGKNMDFKGGPMKQMMSEMMSKYCTGQGGGFPDCLAMMKSMMEAKTNQSCCTPDKDAAESEERTK